MMRSVKLARIAAQAEVLRLRHKTQRQIWRIIFAAVAAVFLLAMLAALHVAATMALTEYVRPVYAVLIVAGADLLIFLVCLLLALRDQPSAVERDAVLVRRDAQAQLMEAAALTTLVAPMLRMVGTRKVYGLALAALTARYLGGNR